ncbi:MAG: hypothetical protein FWC34_01225 [Bacteroidetes bacterium]|nr:hypothetical protein [Bacteroidota bacterium]
MKNRKLLLLIGVYVVTMTIVILSIYAYFIEKDATVSSLGVGLSAIMAYLIFKLNSNINVESKKTERRIIGLISVITICIITFLFNNNLGVEKAKKEEIAMSADSEELQVKIVEDTIKGWTIIKNSLTDELTKEEEAELIDIAYNHSTYSIRDKAAKELIKKTKKQDIIIKLAYNHSTYSIRDEAANKLIEKSDDKDVIRNLSKKHSTYSIRDKAAVKLMNWHSTANNYFQ